MKKTLLFAIVVLVTSLTLSRAGEKHDGEDHGDHAMRHGASSTSIELSPPLRALLSEEMVAIDGGMREIVGAIARGDHGTIATVATKIEHSFILRRKLSEEQKHELHRRLPPDFLDRDRAFHGTAAKLAAAAKSHDSELVVFYTSRLLAGCVDCHGRYAPDLSEPTTEAEDHHH